MSKDFLGRKLDPRTMTYTYGGDDVVLTEEDRYEFNNIAREVTTKCLGKDYYGCVNIVGYFAAKDYVIGKAKKRKNGF